MEESYTYRRFSVHQALGGGLVADVLLWRNWSGALVVLGGATALWYLFERAGYNLLSFIANVLFLLVVILFLWAKAASLLNRPLPPLPDMEISEQSVVRAADILKVWVNRALSIAREIAIGRNLKLLIQVVLSLWLISYIGSLCNFITLIYLGVLLSLSVPVLYEKYRDPIDSKLLVTHGIVQRQFSKLDNSILKKIPSSSNKQKKAQ